MKEVMKDQHNGTKRRLKLVQDEGTTELEGEMKKELIEQEYEIRSWLLRYQGLENNHNQLLNSEMSLRNTFDSF